MFVDLAAAAACKIRCTLGYIYIFLVYRCIFCNCVLYTSECFLIRVVKCRLYYSKKVNCSAAFFPLPKCSKFSNKSARIAVINRVIGYHNYYHYRRSSLQLCRINYPHKRSNHHLHLPVSIYNSIRHLHTYTTSTTSPSTSPFSRDNARANPPPRDEALLYRRYISGNINKAENHWPPLGSRAVWAN